MATITQEPGKLHEALWNGEISLTAAGATFMVMICTNTYSFDQDTHKYKSSVTNEVTGTGYTAGGQALTSVAASYTSAGNKFIIDAADIVIPAITGLTTARKFVIYYKNTALSTDAVRPIIAVITMDVDKDMTSGFTLILDADGFYKHTTPDTNP